MVPSLKVAYKELAIPNNQSFIAVFLLIKALNFHQRLIAVDGNITLLQKIRENDRQI